MALRKCHSCNNIVSTESKTCPICGCNHRMRFLRRLFTWTLMLAVALWLVHSRLPAHLQIPHLFR